MSLLHIGLDTFQTVAFSLAPGVRESTCKLFKSGISILYTDVVLLDINPIGFQSQTFRDSSLWCRSQGLGCLLYDTEPSFLRENICTCDIASDCGSLNQL